MSDAEFTKTLERIREYVRQHRSHHANKEDCIDDIVEWIDRTFLETEAKDAAR